MRVLYIANNQTNDFLSDAVFHGLSTLQDIEVIDYHPLWYMYSSINPTDLVDRFHGRGFTYYACLPPNNNDRSNIEEKIATNYFDKVVYGNVRRCLDLFELVKQYYDPESIILLDGNDEHNQPGIWGELVHNGKYFRRELSTKEALEYPSAKPIQFAFPKQKIQSQFPDKEKVLAQIIPGVGHTFTFNDEQSYHYDYQVSLFGYTWRKAGWDCLRHYEILCNNCIPLFLDIEYCPSTICTTIPKQLLIEYYKKSGLYDLFEMNKPIEYDDRRTIVVNRDLTLINDYVFDDNMQDLYLKYLDKLMIYNTNNLTTENLAKHIIK